MARERQRRVPAVAGGKERPAPCGTAAARGDGEQEHEARRPGHTGSSIRAGGRAHAWAVKTLCTRNPSSS
jgi:hypothetical protein